MGSSPVVSKQRLQNWYLLLFSYARMVCIIVYYSNILLFLGEFKTHISLVFSGYVIYVPLDLYKVCSIIELLHGQIPNRGLSPQMSVGLYI